MNTSLVAFFFLLARFANIEAAARVVANDVLTGSCTEIVAAGKQHIIFEKGKLFFNPRNPVIPGTFNIHANVTVSTVLQYVAAELELRFDWNSEPLPCQQRQADGCGGKGSCSYCDFCKNFRRLNPEINGHTLDEQQTSCPIHPGNYEINVNVDVNDKTFFDKNLPVDLLNDLGPNRQIPLYVTLWLYGTRFQELNPYLNANARSKVFEQNKRSWIAGCYRIITTVEYAS